MAGVQVGKPITLEDEIQEGRGPRFKVRAVLPVKENKSANGWAGITTKRLKAVVNGEEFEIYADQFSDHKREGKHKGWMEFVNASDRKVYEDWKAGKKAKA